MQNLEKNIEQEAVDSNSFIINQVDLIIKNAIKSSASDIHIESGQDGARLRYRIDGILYDQPKIQENIKSQVVSRIKVLSNINLAEKRVPQDGKFIISSEDNLKNIDLRVSTFPSIYGEKVVIRILDRSKNMIRLDALGFDRKMEKDFISLLERPSGFILVTGPTGSGKTTTLYASLSHLNSPQKNIITLEDPVEYNLDGITQGQIHTDAGFTFAKGIRAVLRQDPDIAMIGEIRDKETAQTAIEASLTGHQVFSTLHTNDAPGAIMRLMDMRIEPFLLNAALTGVLAQRLARKICDNCKAERAVTDKEKKLLDKIIKIDKTVKNFGLDINKLYYGSGCDSCFNLGYRGRTGLFELLTVSQELRSLVIESPKFDDIRSRAILDGMTPMIIDGLHKVNLGEISLDELVRVVW
ncbi:MAG: General secretion pathway protein E (Type II traffic warden ATPase)(Cholera toxin secretion protein EpsE) [candidate division TM6 bacterium GW2011_GWF2_30_66]|jgi:type II secretory ATPase GspE/PulE/Tfp pilus assembly ATPase PilB-like protein|nr:MAG: General secretion pathway protein E (Type II traffic warden ATPase)(Cholera toxin secretion protein EpsE) [candidate division TM6 bacterium GW2011_GWF2_30_66]